MNPNPGESKMLEEVRKWRKDAYEEDPAKTLEERARNGRELRKEMGLDLRIATKIHRVVKSQD
jgi:hypothetical protein